MTENVLISNKHVLLCIDTKSNNPELDYIKNNFCGLVVSDLNNFVCSPDAIIYLCGNIAQISNNNNNKNNKNWENKLIYVIGELSYNYDNCDYPLIEIGIVPINVHNVGVYFPKFFNSNNKDYFDSISHEHQFQELTESNKPTNAFRKGIYLTNVEQNNEETKFNLLRCSTNFVGPSCGFASTDNLVINQVNGVSKLFFEQEIQFNHVLAQIYENSMVVSDNSNNKERKATIKAHSDKTKDIPRNGLIAFCTFYENYSNDKFDSNLCKHIKKSENDMFDYCYKEQSVLTRLLFRLKKDVLDPSLVKEFSITLYPNSVFIIPLSTNRLYTHEIKPSVLPIDKIPVRMGYVIRCSNTKAVFKDGQTFIIGDDEKYIKLEEPTEENVKELKDVYFKENITDEIINYNDVHFSLNKGDYMCPKAF